MCPCCFPFPLDYSVAFGIESSSPDEARAVYGCGVVSWWGIDGGVVGGFDSGGAGSFFCFWCGFGCPQQEGTFLVVFVHVCFCSWLRCGVGV